MNLPAVSKSCESFCKFKSHGNHGNIACRLPLKRFFSNYFNTDTEALGPLQYRLHS